MLTELRKGNHPKTVVVVPIRGIVVVPIRYATVRRVVVPTAAAQDAVRTFLKRNLYFKNSIVD
jgi:hypothetical protein